MKTKRVIAIIIGATVFMTGVIYLIFFSTGRFNLVNERHVLFNGDPIVDFQNIFEENNYKVNVGGLAAATFPQYYEKGELIRIGDELNEPNSSYMIFKNNKVFIVYNVDGKFKEFSKEESTMYEETKKSSPFYSLKKIIENQKQPVSWIDMGDGYLMTESPLNLNSGIDDEEMIVNFKMKMNTEGFITEIFLELEDNEWEKWFDMQYELIGDVTDLKQFPIDYEKVN